MVGLLITCNYTKP